MTKFVIRGTGDAAQALLKGNLAAQDAKFNANLDAFFKPPVTAEAPVAAAAPAAPAAVAFAAPVTTAKTPAAKPAKTNAWELGQIRTRGFR